MNRRPLNSSAFNLGLFLVAALAAASEAASAQDFYTGPRTQYGWTNGSSGFAAKPRASNCPNGQCTSGSWLPTPGTSRSLWQPSRPVYSVAPAVTTSPGTFQYFSTTNRESPFYGESDLKSASPPGIVAPPQNAVRTRNNDSPFYQ